MIQWEDLRHLLAAHRTGSLAAAARTLGVDATTVGRRIAAAERALGARLVTRTPDGLRTTAAGREAAAAAARMEDAAEGVARRVAGGDGRVAGTVRLTTGEGMAAELLAPALPALRARHPELSIELVPSSRSLDLLRGEADLALRLFRPREPGLLARRVAPLPYGLFAAPGYVARAGAPRTPGDLAGHDVLGFDAGLEATPEMRWLLRLVPASALRVRTGSTTTLLAACRAGVGIAALPVRFGHGDARLVRVLPRTELPEREAWLALHPELRRSARVSAVSAWVAEVLRGHPG